MLSGSGSCFWFIWKIFIFLVCILLLNLSHLQILLCYAGSLILSCKFSFCSWFTFLIDARVYYILSSIILKITTVLLFLVLLYALFIFLPQILSQCSPPTSTAAGYCLLLSCLTLSILKVTFTSLEFLMKGFHNRVKHRQSRPCKKICGKWKIIHRIGNMPWKILGLLQWQPVPSQARN